MFTQAASSFYRGTCFYSSLISCFRSSSWREKLIVKGQGFLFCSPFFLSDVGIQRSGRHLDPWALELAGGEFVKEELIKTR